MFSFETLETCVRYRKICRYAADINNDNLHANQTIGTRLESATHYFPFYIKESLFVTFYMYLEKEDYIDTIYIRITYQILVKRKNYSLFYFSVILSHCS